MNIVGKILIFLNLVVALLVVGFITMNFASRTNNSLTADQFKFELDISRKVNQALMETNASLQTALTTAKADLESKRQDLALKQAEWAVAEADLRKMFKDSEDRGKISDINLEKALAAKERMKSEVELLSKTIEDREGRLVVLHAKYKESQDLNIALDRDLRFSQERNQILLARVQELERNISELVSGAKSDAAAALPKDPSAPNPPQKFIKGVVERVVDNSLVQVSLGTDHGLVKNNTLEVYRLAPNAEYVGMIRILEANHHTSVGRLIRTPGAGQRIIREGDVVSSSLGNR